MTIQNKLQEFINKELLSGSFEVETDESLLADGMVDSLGMLRLVTFIEETYETRIPPEDLIIENFHTIDVIAGYLTLKGIPAGE
ncbi:MAG: acyl carrier protein [Calditrichia bacterium]